MNILNSDQIHFQKPPLKDFLQEYNQLLANILVDNFSSFSYLASATINRLEAQTHFFEKLEKYIQIKNMLKNDPGLVVRLVDKDVFLQEFLKPEFGGRVISNSKTSCQIRRFWPRYSLLFIYNLVFTFLGMFLLKKHKKYDYIIRSYYDWRNFGDKMREEYFSHFAEDLSQDYQTLVIFKLLQRKDFLQYLKIRNKSSFDSCILESFLTPWTVVKAFMKYLKSHIHLHQRVIYKGHDITTLLQTSLDDDYYSMRGIGVYLEYEAAKKIIALSPKQVMFPYENQTWEKVYPYVRQRMNKNVSILGFQHSGFSYKLLNFFPAFNEKNLPVFPDKIVTMGEITTRILKEKAFYPSEIVTGAALRQMKHIKNIKHGKFTVKSPTNQIYRKIAYAFSYDIERYKAIVEFLLKVFADSNILVYLKFHPDYKEQDVLRFLDCVLPNNFIPAQSIHWDNVYNSVDIILYNDNSIGVEGMINGVKTLMIDIADPIYNCERFFYFSLGESIVDNDLIQIRKELEDGTFIKYFSEEIVSDYVNQYYNVYSKEDCFKSFIV